MSGKEEDKGGQAKEVSGACFYARHSYTMLSVYVDQYVNCVGLFFFFLNVCPLIPHLTEFRNLEKLI